MHILVVSPIAGDARALVAALSSKEHAVETAVTDESARGLLEQSAPFDVLLLDWRSRGPANILLEALHERYPEMALLAVVDVVVPATIDAIEAAGFHDFMRKPVSVRELAYRIHRACSSASNRSSSPNTPAPKTTADLFAWSNIEALICRDLSAMVGREGTTSAEIPNAERLHAAKIDVVHVTAGTNVHFTVAFDADSVRNFAMEMVGDAEPSQALCSDIVGEMTNTIAGAFQRAAACEGEILTLGLPRVVKPEAYTRARRSFFVQLGAGVSLSVHVDIESKKIEHLRPDLLREGMVLVRDVLSGGALLVAGGTRLTQVNADRLGRILPPHSVVQVAVPG